MTDSAPPVHRTAADLGFLRGLIAFPSLHRELGRIGWTVYVLRGRANGRPTTLGAAFRWIWTRHVLRHDGEVCHRCGRRVDRGTDSWWSAPDDLWIECNEGFGILCPACFHGLARARGRLVHFVAEVWHG